MSKYSINFSDLESGLNSCGSSWLCAQSHGLLCGRLAVLGPNAFNLCIEQIFDNTSSQKVSRDDCVLMLEDLFKDTWAQLVERQSEFELFLPDDERNITERTEAISQWCDGFLHGIVTGKKPKKLKDHLNQDPLNVIIKDFLEITRATVNEEADEEDNESAFEEVMEYIRVSVQLVYEELADFRDDAIEKKIKNQKDLN
jgi:hypothetical protein|tara:strand:+ start:233 stop:829 length:597 start_codon:yes stop_codon:yes gene_type:complete